MTVTYSLSLITESDDNDASVLRKRFVQDRDDSTRRRRGCCQQVGRCHGLFALRFRASWMFFTLLDRSEQFQRTRSRGVDGAEGFVAQTSFRPCWTSLAFNFLQSNSSSFAQTRRHESFTKKDPTNNSAPKNETFFFFPIVVPFATGSFGIVFCVKVPERFCWNAKQIYLTNFLCFC